MVIKYYFWIYIGAFLACSIALAAIVNKFAAGFAASGKKPYMYGAISSVIASMTAYGSTFIADHLFVVYWLLSGIFFLFGIIHNILVHKRFFYTASGDGSKTLLGEIIFGMSVIFFTIVVFSSLQYFLGKKAGDFLFYPMLLSTIMFFVPFLFMKTFDAAYNIPPAVFKTWNYPLQDILEVPDEKPGEKLLVIAFELAKKTTDRKRTFFRAKAPESMNLGELFYHFINDYNEQKSETTIQFTATDHAPHEWWFRRKPKWYQLQRILDPDITVRENVIKENTVIICERLYN